LSLNGFPLVRLNGAAIGYADRPVVRDVDLTIERGEVVALLGPNGSGKTTLVRGILGLARLLGGSLELFGVPHERFRERARIGYVPQRHTVVGTVPSTVREVVSSGRLALRSAFARPTAADKTAVEHAIATVGLSDHAGNNVSELSGGQQRRVLIARALASQPDPLVMDEPTAGVDSTNQGLLTQTLARLVDEGVTLLVVTHEVGPLVPLVTRAVVMREGRKAYDGPLLASMVGASDGGDHHDIDDLGPANRLGLTGWAEER